LAPALMADRFGRDRGRIRHIVKAGRILDLRSGLDSRRTPSRTSGVGDQVESGDEETWPPVRFHTLIADIPYCLFFSFRPRPGISDGNDPGTLELEVQPPGVFFILNINRRGAEPTLKPAARACSNCGPRSERHPVRGRATQATALSRHNRQTRMIGKHSPKRHKGHQEERSCRASYRSFFPMSLCFVLFVVFVVISI